MKKQDNNYHPAFVQDNIKVVAEGSYGEALEILADYLSDLGRLARQARPAPLPDPETPNSMLLERAQFAGDYAAALATRLSYKPPGRPHKSFTMLDAFCAIHAAQEYKKLKGTVPQKQLEQEILSHYGISRALLRAAIKNNLPDVEVPGIHTVPQSPDK
jgi:hypothetical protein